MEQRIASLLPPTHPWRDRITCLASTDSTNTRLAALAKSGAPHGTVLIADAQTGGRGRMGRSFHSPAGKGLYMSILLRPQCAPSELMHLTCAAAVAACDAIERTVGIRPQIKWTNDLVCGERKLAGILTELGFGANGTLSYAILGIGINCLHTPEDFPPELRSIATSLAQLTHTPIDRAALAAALITAFSQMSDTLLTQKRAMLDVYRRDCVTLGKQISVVRADSIRHGTALDICDDGALTVHFSDGSTENVNSGEVSIRGMYGYV